ncbi:DMT family transporter [Arthrobacter ginkgonis]|uniref:DMT family transporter n=1 Tax=Arthrobacter ginkgonis TaxID=1630594 RepID=A0ABP7CXX9_9MICC
MIFLLAALGVLGASASGPIIAATPGVSPLAMAFWRNVLGAGVMAVPMVVREPAALARAGRRGWGWSAVAALALALHFVCFMSSVRMTSVATATALACLQSVWIALFQRLGGIRLPWAVAGGIAVAFAGVVTITGFDLGGDPRALQGDALAIVGGMLAGAYTLAGSKARETLATGPYTTLCYGMTALILLALCVAFHVPLWGFGLAGWLGILALTVFAQLMGHTIFNHVVKHLGPLTVSTLILLEIPGAALIAALLLGESLPVATYAGMALIMAGLAAVVRGQRAAAPVKTAEPAELPL